MRRNLTSCIIAIALCAVGSLAQASDLTALLFGRHTEIMRPGVTYAIDQKVPTEWLKNATLSVTYWNETAPVYQGTVLRISVLVLTGDEDSRQFAVCVSDSESGEYRGSDDPSKMFRGMKPKSYNALGGFRPIGAFVGKTGTVELDTSRMEPGSYFLYTFVRKGRKNTRFHEEPVVIRLAPPLGRVIRAMQGSPAETLKNWGLEESEEEVSPTRRTSRDSEELRDDVRAELVEHEDEPNFASGATIYLGRRGEKGFVLQQTVRAGSFPTTVNTKDMLVFGRNAEARVIGINPDRKTITAIVSGRVQQGDPIKVVRGGRQ